MAYVKAARTYRLVWDEGPLAGLEVRVRSLPIKVLADLMPLIDQLSDPSIPVETQTPALAAAVDCLQGVADRLIGWNIQERDDTTGTVRDVPADLEGLLTLDRDEVYAIIRAWMEAAGTAPAPLEPASPSGAVEASLPMDALPGSPGS